MVLKKQFLNICCDCYPENCIVCSKSGSEHHSPFIILKNLIYEPILQVSVCNQSDCSSKVEKLFAASGGEMLK